MFARRAAAASTSGPLWISAPGQPELTAVSPTSWRPGPGGTGLGPLALDEGPASSPDPEEASIIWLDPDPGQVPELAVGDGLPEPISVATEPGPSRLDTTTADTLALLARVRAAVAAGELQVWADTGLPSITAIQRYLRCEKRRAQGVWDALSILAPTPDTPDDTGASAAPPGQNRAQAARTSPADPGTAHPCASPASVSGENAVVLHRPFVWQGSPAPAGSVPDPIQLAQTMPSAPQPGQFWLPAPAAPPAAEMVSRWSPRRPDVRGPKPVGKSKRRWRRPRTAPATNPTTGRVVSVERPLASWEPVSVSEACGYAVRFGADYLSWDELEPARRPAALREYLADPAWADVGWSGIGRQRADLVTAGRTVVVAGGSVVIVEVTARVVLYRRTSADADVWSPPAGEATPSLAFAPSSAPPSTVPGWEPGAAWWVRIAPPVRRDHAGRLVIDLGLDLSTTES